MLHTSTLWYTYAAVLSSSFAPTARNDHTAHCHMHSYFNRHHRDRVGAIGKGRILCVRKQLLRRLKLHIQNAPKTASPRHCEKIVLLGGT